MLGIFMSVVLLIALTIVGVSTGFNIAYATFPIVKLKLDKGKGLKPRFISKKVYKFSESSIESLEEFEVDRINYMNYMFSRFVIVSVITGILISGVLLK